MLTTSTKGRALDYSRVIGGRLFRGIVYIALGEDNDVYAVLRDSYNSGIVKLTIGEELDDEEEILSFANVSEGVFEQSWPACAVIQDKEVFVTDELQNCILVFNTDRQFIRKFGESGNKDGQFDRPSGITLDKWGNLLVADTLNHRVQQITPSGEFISAFGSHGTLPGELNAPWGIETARDGAIFVADHLNNRIQKFDESGNLILELGNTGTDTERLNHPSDVALDPDGDVYVADWVNNRIQIYNSEGTYIASLEGAAFELSKWQQQYVRGNPDVHKARRRVATLEPEKWFALPTSVAFDPIKSRLLAVDSQRWRIQVYDKLDGYSDPQFNI